MRAQNRLRLAVDDPEFRRLAEQFAARGLLGRIREQPRCLIDSTRRCTWPLHLLGQREPEVNDASHAPAQPPAGYLGAQLQALAESWSCFAGPAAGQLISSDSPCSLCPAGRLVLGGAVNGVTSRSVWPRLPTGPAPTARAAPGPWPSIPSTCSSAASSFLAISSCLAGARGACARSTSLRHRLFGPRRLDDLAGSSQMAHHGARSGAGLVDACSLDGRLAGSVAARRPGSISSRRSDPPQPSLSR
jgi:hypothetical protein